MTALVCGTFMLPIAILLFFVVANVNEFIDFARWETYGTLDQRRLEDLSRLCRTTARLASIDQDRNA